MKSLPYKKFSGKDLIKGDTHIGFLGPVGVTDKMVLTPDYRNAVYRTAFLFQFISIVINYIRDDANEADFSNRTASDKQYRHGLARSCPYLIKPKGSDHWIDVCFTITNGIDGWLPLTSSTAIYSQWNSINNKGDQIPGNVDKLYVPSSKERRKFWGHGKQDKNKMRALIRKHIEECYE